MAFKNDIRYSDLTLDQTLKIEMAQLNMAAAKLELLRRLERETNKAALTIEPSHLAYAAAYPLNKFIKETFNILEPGIAYKDNWHIDAISELLTAATVGQVRNVLINIPRRGMKSSLICVMWPCWTWTFLPHTRWSYASYNESFAWRDSRHCRKIIKSAYYQQKFGNTFSLTTDKKDLFENDKGGARACFGVTKGTGEGADFQGVDDPHQISESASEKIIETTVQWYFETYAQNVRDPLTVVRFIVHQRVGEDDLTGAILARELGFEHLVIPMEWEDDHPHRNSMSKPLNLGTVTAFEKSKNPNLEVGHPKLWMDPRDPEAPNFTNTWWQEWYKKSFLERGLKSEGVGQLYWENRFPSHIVEGDKLKLGSYGTACQLQQRPIKRGGNFFNSALFLEHGLPVEMHTLDLDNMVFCRFWDKSATDGAGDWTVGLLMGRTKTMPYYFYILDMIRVQYSYYKRMELIVQTAKRDYEDFVASKRNSSLSIGIEGEKNGSGRDLSTIEKDALVGYDVFIELPKEDKETRAKPVKSFSESGRIKIVKGPWNDIFLRRLERFVPGKKKQKDDEVDTLAYCFKHMAFGISNRRLPISGYY